MLPIKVLNLVLRSYSNTTADRLPLNSFVFYIDKIHLKKSSTRDPKPTRPTVDDDLQMQSSSSGTAGDQSLQTPTWSFGKLLPTTLKVLTKSTSTRTRKIWLRE